MTEHPITPPPELVHQWHKVACKDPCNGGTFFDSKVLKSIATQAAQWGYEQRAAVNEAELQKARDEELEAVIEWMMKMHYWGEDGKAIPALRAARRPKPKSQAEEALTLLDDASDRLDAVHENTFRRALERLQELEGQN